MADAASLSRSRACTLRQCTLGRGAGLALVLGCLVALLAALFVENDRFHVRMTREMYVTRAARLPNYPSARALQTGSILLFSRHRLQRSALKIIMYNSMRMYMNDAWTHVGLLMRDPLTGMPLVAHMQHTFFVEPLTVAFRRFRGTKLVVPLLGEAADGLYAHLPNLAGYKFSVINVLRTLGLPIPPQYAHMHFNCAQTTVCMLALSGVVAPPSVELFDAVTPAHFVVPRHALRIRPSSRFGIGRVLDDYGEYAT